MIFPYFCQNQGSYNRVIDIKTDIIPYSVIITLAGAKVFVNLVSYEYAQNYFPNLPVEQPPKRIYCIYVQLGTAPRYHRGR